MFPAGQRRALLRIVEVQRRKVAWHRPVATGADGPRLAAVHSFMPVAQWRQTGGGCSSPFTAQRYDARTRFFSSGSNSFSDKEDEFIRRNENHAPDAGSSSLSSLQQRSTTETMTLSRSRLRKRFAPVSTRDDGVSTRNGINGFSSNDNGSLARLGTRSVHEGGRFSTHPQLPRSKKLNQFSGATTSLDTTNTGFLQSPSASARFQDGALRSKGRNGNSPRFNRREDGSAPRAATIPVGKMFPLSAVHVAQTIDLVPLFQEASFARQAQRKQVFGKNSAVILELAPAPSGSNTTAPRFVAVYRFGSVVLINVSPRDTADILRDIKNYAKRPVPQGLERGEQFGILLSGGNGGDHELTSSSQRTFVTDPEHVVTGDYCVVPDLTLNAVAVISNILGQTVALDTYNDTVDELLTNFASINANVARTGKFSGTDRDVLFRTVAQNNSLFIDMIAKIRIKDRSDTAWNLTEYDAVDDGLKTEFELDKRFDQIEYKLQLIQDNAKFFLDVMQSQKSNSLEWGVVMLIGVECVLMCIDMSGYGEICFKLFTKSLGFS